jgi:SAM-dependent methyltransferase
MTDKVQGDIYDYPVYYDLIFGSDWRAEYDFLTGCFERFAKRPVKRLFEPACGTGRLLIKLAEHGYEVSGNDLNENAVKFCNDRFRRKGFPETAVVGDMADFKLKRKADAAFNTINTFRHLLTEKLAVAHLQCMADALAKGGIYILGLHLIPSDPDDRIEDEAWHARRGNLVVNTYMWSKGIDEKTRAEYLGMKINVYTPTKHLEIEDEMIYRTYSVRQIRNLIKKVPEFEWIESYDFAYDLDEPTKVGGSTEDVVLILRKK